MRVEAKVEMLGKWPNIFQGFDIRKLAVCVFMLLPFFRDRSSTGLTK